MSKTFSLTRQDRPFLTQQGKYNFTKYILQKATNSTKYKHEEIYKQVYQYLKSGLNSNYRII